MGPRAAKVLRTLPIPLVITPALEKKDESEEAGE